MPDARKVEVEVAIPAGVHIDVNGEFNASSGGTLRVESTATSSDDAKEQLAEFAAAVQVAVSE